MSLRHTTFPPHRTCLTDVIPENGQGRGIAPSRSIYGNLRGLPGGIMDGEDLRAVSQALTGHPEACDEDCPYGRGLSHTEPAHPPTSSTPDRVVGMRALSPTHTQFIAQYAPPLTIHHPNFLGPPPARDTCVNGRGTTITPAALRQWSRESNSLAHMADFLYCAANFLDEHDESCNPTNQPSHGYHPDPTTAPHAGPSTSSASSSNEPSHLYQTPQAGASGPDPTPPSPTWPLITT